MNFRRNICRATLATAFVVGVCGVHAADYSKLGTELTTLGGERSGNKAGTIPEYAGMTKPNAGWTIGKVREDFWQHKSEKPLYVIDSSNVDKYADRLSQGQVAMIKSVKGYTMPVYPTHRECSVPDFVENNTKKHAGKAKIAKDGWSLESAVLPATPFPIPSSGIEVMWNWLSRYTGLAFEQKDGYTYVSPRPGSEAPIITRWGQLWYTPWAKNTQGKPIDLDGLQYGVYYLYSEPAALAGVAAVNRAYYNKDQESFSYFTGQRRVRRLPNYAYDAPLIGYENQYPADTSYVFSGNPDRFDWKLVGKKEIFVPANNFAMLRTNAKLSDVTTPNFVNPDFRRYELRRVWEVEANVKSGMRHASPKKTMYIDEDSWNLVVSDDYDVKGQIWRTKENYIVPIWEIGACAPVASVYTDLVGRRYILDNTVVGTGKDYVFYPPNSVDTRLKDDFFTANNLQLISGR